MNKRFILPIIILIIVGVIGCFYVSSFMALFRLTSFDNKSEFFLNSVINVAEERITQQVTTYNKDSLVEFDCLIDSICCINIVKVGKTKYDNLEQIIFFSQNKFSLRDEGLISKMASPFPFSNKSISNLSINYLSDFNVYLLPINKIDKITVHVEGEIIDQVIKTHEMISYLIKSKVVSFAFNNFNKEDMKTMYTHVTDIPVSNLVFYKDMDGNVYIMNISTLDGSIPKIEYQNGQLGIGSELNDAF